MKLITTSSKVTGTPSALGWVQIHEFSPSDGDKTASRGHIFLVIATERFKEDGGDINGLIAGRELISRFQEEYYGDLSQKPFEALKKSVEKVTGEFTSSFGTIEIAACALVDNVIYSAAGGGGQVIILRDGMMATILASTDKETISASGYPKAGDMFLLGTRNFFTSIPQEIIKASLESKDLEDATEVFASIVHGREDSGSMGAIVVKFKEEVGNPVSASPVFVSTERKSDMFSGFLSKFGKSFPERKIYISSASNEESSPSGKKLTLTVGVMLLLILAVSIGFGIRQKKIKNLESQYMERLSQANHNLDEAGGLLGVDSPKARELFSQSDQIYKEISSIGAKDPKIDELGSRLEVERANILGEYTNVPELFLDLSLLSSG
ncbi:MAG: hypothetical protein Q8L28_00210, partial [bacterium]|nr:hypothetical protein [bacterium]